MFFMNNMLWDDVLWIVWCGLQDVESLPQYSDAIVPTLPAMRATLTTIIGGPCGTECTALIAYTCADKPHPDSHVSSVGVPPGMRHHDSSVDWERMSQLRWWAIQVGGQGMSLKFKDDHCYQTCLHQEFKLHPCFLSAVCLVWVSSGPALWTHRTDCTTGSFYSSEIGNPKCLHVVSTHLMPRVFYKFWNCTYLAGWGAVWSDT